jgi:hypothetical protein
MIKSVNHAHLGPIWYLSEPSDGSPILQTNFLVRTFFAVSYSKPALGKKYQVQLEINRMQFANVKFEFLGTF